MLPQVFHESLTEHTLRQQVEALDAQLAMLNGSGDAHEVLVDCCATLVGMCTTALCGSVAPELNEQTKPAIRKLAVDTLLGLVLNMCGDAAARAGSGMLELFVDKGVLLVETQGVAEGLCSPSSRHVRALGDSGSSSMQDVLKCVAAVLQRQRHLGGWEERGGGVTDGGGGGGSGRRGGARGGGGAGQRGWRRSRSWRGGARSWARPGWGRGG
eukprot:TRINITY_DN11904_c0_g2_i1.p3 TRINITY_DN11904_c0_g2~~TRINITY_DN11904_c0_g2_i1.p3  ORF type:complete len:213 (+),score=26.23 TRINITY_DN11904_c0_g2_i1:622-1260(+)